MDVDPAGILIGVGTGRGPVPRALLWGASRQREGEVWWVVSLHRTHILAALLPAAGLLPRPQLGGEQTVQGDPPWRGLGDTESQVLARTNALQESESSYRGLFNSVRLAMYVLDRETAYGHRPNPS